MPYKNLPTHPYHIKHPPKCKYCEKKVRQNIINGRNKGYCATCGDEKCLKVAYENSEVRAKKVYNKIHLCGKCQKEYLAHGRRQRWCYGCAPNRSAVAILHRYNISYPEYRDMVEKNSNCPICLRKLENPVIDHDHKTGSVRGMICNHCNLALNLIEDNEKLKRALNYLKI